MNIEVILTDSSCTGVKVLALKEGATVEDAVIYSGLLAERTDVDRLGFGIWGQIVPKTQVLSDGDRVEIYRPLILSPRERRLLVVKKKKGRMTKRHTPLRGLNG